jgi:endonuclease/exonuclease/phosphatase (EEP) superfamily protein YafD
MPAARATRCVAAGAALPWGLLAALRLAGAERGFPLVPAMAFAPQAALTSVLPLVAAAAAGSRRGAVASAVAGIALTGPVLAARRPLRPMPTPVDGEPLRIATVSLRLGRVRPEPVLELVRRYDVDVLSVQELTPRAEERLLAAGLTDLLPHGHVIPARPRSVPSASGALWSRRPFVEVGAVTGTFEQPAVRLLRPDGRDVEIVAVHTMPPAPSPARVRCWSDDLAALPGPEAGVLRVLAGDFNATLDHAALRAVLARGYVDAARATGRAGAWTWRPLRAPLPRLSLDHVLVDPRIGIAALAITGVRGSDHRALIADLVLPR